MKNLYFDGSKQMHNIFRTRNKITVVVLLGVIASVISQEIQNPPNEILKQTPEIVEARKPYSFAWSASRHYNGNPDREHKEERGTDGITRGVFRYIDPRNQIQEVVYVADEHGFHVEASNLPQDTDVVRSAKLRHQSLFDKIAAEHARIAETRFQEQLQQEQQLI